MIKVVIAGVWVCVVTLAAVYFSVTMATKPPVDENADKKAQVEMVKGESITVPNLKDGAIQGYFIGRVSYLMDKEKLKGVTLPMTEYMTDEMFALLVGNPMIEITNPKAFNLEEFKKKVKEDLNKRLGDEYVTEILVEQLDYMSKEEIHIGQSGGKPKPPTQLVKPETPAAAGGEGAPAEAAAAPKE